MTFFNACLCNNLYLFFHLYSKNRPWFLMQGRLASPSRLEDLEMALPIICKVLSQVDSV